MLFSHHIEASLARLVDLVNTAPESGSPDRLPDLIALRSWVDTNGVSGVVTLTDTDLVAVHALRPRFRRVFVARSDQESVDAINDLVAQAPVSPRLTDHGAYGWHVHYFAEGAAVADHLAVDGGMALAQVVAAGERERLRTCAAPDCDNALVDLSRNRSKRYCDARTCGNRQHVAAYRSRLRQSR